jgi:hypothetical protein
MIRLIAKVRLQGALVNGDGEAVTRIEAGEVLMADKDNAPRLIRRKQAIPAPAPSKKKSTKKG